MRACSFYAAVFFTLNHDPNFSQMRGEIQGASGENKEASCGLGGRVRVQEATPEIAFFAIPRISLKLNPG